MKHVLTLGFGLVLVGAALLLGDWWGRSHATPAAQVAATVAAPKILYWYDPMLPQEHHAGPGKSSMGMTLVPKYADATDVAGVRIDPATRQDIGLRTIRVQRGRLATAIAVPGTLAWNLADERIVSTRVDAVVARLDVRAPFTTVAAGQPLAELIAPAWWDALAEAGALRDARSGTARALRQAAQARLGALGLPTGARVRDGRVVLVAPIAGVVSELGAREGQAAPAGTLLFRIDATTTVWVEAAIPQAQIAGIGAGTPADIRVDGYPEAVFHGQVERMLPDVDPTSRTQRARIVVANPHGELAPGQFARVLLRPAAGAEHPLVPSQALIGAGAQQRVIVQDADGRFRPVRVRVGRSSQGQSEILDGLRGGERVVASGQFLIDSEANLSGALQRLQTGASASDDADAASGSPP